MGSFKGIYKGLGLKGLGFGVWGLGVSRTCLCSRTTGCSWSKRNSSEDDDFRRIPDIHAAHDVYVVICNIFGKTTT